MLMFVWSDIYSRDSGQIVCLSIITGFGASLAIYFGYRFVFAKNLYILCNIIMELSSVKGIIFS